MIPIFLLNSCKGNLSIALGNEACGKFKGLPKGFVILEPTLGGIVLSDTVLSGTDKLIDVLNGLAAYATKEREIFADFPLTPAIFPYYPKLVNFEPNGGEPNIQTEGFGSGIPNGITAYSEKYTIIDGGECMYKQLLALEERPLELMKIDDDDVLYGTIKAKGDNVFLHGMTCYISVTMRENTGSQSGAIVMTVTYSSNYKKEREAQIAINLDEEIRTINEISVKAVSASAFKVVSSCSGKSILASNPTMQNLFIIQSVYTLNGQPIEVLADEITYDSVTDTLVIESGPALNKARDLGFVENFAAAMGVETLKYLKGNPASLNNPFAK